MANSEHLEKLKGPEIWNRWREQNPEIEPDLGGANLRNVDLTGANLSGAYLSKADLRDANLTGANLSGAHLGRADLSGAKLSQANLSLSHLGRADLFRAALIETNLSAAQLSKTDLREANLRGANLEGADLSGADLKKADLGKADLSRAFLSETDLCGAYLIGARLNDADLGHAHLRNADLRKANFEKASLRGAFLCRAILKEANLKDADLREANLSLADLSWATLTRADLRMANLVQTNLDGADITACSVYGISTWNVSLVGTNQSNLVITPPKESAIEVDNLEVAQFIFSFLDNANVQHMVDNINSKIVLILGRLTPERKAFLDTIRRELRQRNYLPVLFDFDRHTRRNFAEIVSSLANMARLVIADITDADGILGELQRIVPDLSSVPIQPLILVSRHEEGMFEHFVRYTWFLEPILYDDQIVRPPELCDRAIASAEAKAKVLSQK